MNERENRKTVKKEWWFERRLIDPGDSPDRVRERVGSLVEDLGLGHFAFVLGTPRRAREGEDGLDVLTNYPAAWSSRYRERGYHAVDPVIEAAGRSARPYFWGGGGFLRSLSKPQRRVLEEAREFGLAAGWAVPAHGSGGEFGLFTVAADDAARLEEVVRGGQEDLLAVAWSLQEFLLDRVARTEGAPVTPALTARERSCLLWTAEGKTATETGALLGLSVHTVNRHLSRAARKLGCRDKYQAAIRALRANLV